MDRSYRKVTLTASSGGSAIDEAQEGLIMWIVITLY